MRAPNRPAAYVNHINHLYIFTKAGACAPVSGDVELLTGQRARTFQDYVDETWSASDTASPHAREYSTFL
jgi:hypothetical protein